MVQTERNDRKLDFPLALNSTAMRNPKERIGKESMLRSHLRDNLVAAEQLHPSC